ncbi:30S ribosome-binding factor RbfA [Rhodoligotrophos defluvii]|uniref:30S ribosome-binding factor RbfA n=1 Tax=Rhodoligotrophos defluvii TaxID=2561934 RepID=UPI0010C94B7B|nr:30S ribosome-binding factor RbfA [Rhodoligotrophos defluvii]
MADHRKGAPSQRQLRVGELIRHALAEIFSRGDTYDPALDGAVTVVEVSMSPDLRHATAYVMPFAGHRSNEVMAALERSRKRIRGEVGRRVTLKFLPDLHFRQDTSLDYAARVDEILHRPDVARDLARRDEDDQDHE